MAAARAGIITEEMKAVAAKEYRTEEEIRDLVARGQVAICSQQAPQVSGSQRHRFHAQDKESMSTWEFQGTARITT